MQELIKLEKGLKNHNSEVYIQKIFDPIQNHAVYGIKNKEILEDVRNYLKKYGGTKFRIVKLKKNSGFILCFKFQIMNPKRKLEFRRNKIQKELPKMLRPWKTLKCFIDAGDVHVEASRLRALGKEVICQFEPTLKLMYR